MVRATRRQRPGHAGPQTQRFTPDQESAVDALLDVLQDGGARSYALVLGAGASKPLGYPLTRDLMLRIFEGLRAGTILESGRIGPGAVSKTPCKELHDYLVELLPGERASRSEVPFVTGVLSLLDYSLATGQALLPGRSLDKTRRMRQLLERAILEVIPDDEPFDGDEQQTFDRLCEWLTALGGAEDRHVGLVTTNYDMVADVAAMRAAGVSGTIGDWSFDDVARKIDFGFRWAHPESDRAQFFARPAAPAIALFKLHGSTNWLRCPLCENLYINPNGPIAWLADGKDRGTAAQCHCSRTRLEAQIVSPSFVREMREPNLISTWKSALDFLRDATDWIFIGYSFPDEDVAIRAMFTRAFGSHHQAHKRPPSISVVQWDDSARLNYESFFPRGTVRYVTGGLDLLLERWSTRPA